MIDRAFFGGLAGNFLPYGVQNVLTLTGIPAEWIIDLTGAITLGALVVSRVASGKGHMA